MKLTLKAGRVMNPHNDEEYTALLRRVRANAAFRDRIHHSCHDIVEKLSVETGKETMAVVGEFC